MKTEAQTKTRIIQLETKIERLEKIANAPQVTLGPFETGRSGYTMGKKLDAENNRRANAFRECEAAKKERDRLEILLANYKAGETHLNGQPRKDAPSRQRKKSGDNLIAEFMREHVKVGDSVAIAFNPKNSITVKRVNPKSITAESGSKWAYHEILLIENGIPLELNQKRFWEKVKTWDEARGA